LSDRRDLWAVLVRTVDLHKLLHVRVILQLVEVALQMHLAVLHHNDLVNQVHEIDGMRHKNSGFASELSQKYVLEDLLLDISIEG